MIPILLAPFSLCSFLQDYTLADLKSAEALQNVQNKIFAKKLHLSILNINVCELQLYHIVQFEDIRFAQHTVDASYLQYGSIGKPSLSVPTNTIQSQ